MGGGMTVAFSAARLPSVAFRGAVPPPSPTKACGVSGSVWSAAPAPSPALGERKTIPSAYESRAVTPAFLNTLSALWVCLEANLWE